MSALSTRVPFPVTTVVIPYAARSRSASRRVRRALSLAMLGDVLAACLPIGRTRVVTSDADGAAVARGGRRRRASTTRAGSGRRRCRRSRGRRAGRDADRQRRRPCAVPADLRALLAATPAGGIALVEAPDGTTNALSISAADTSPRSTAPAARRAFARTRASSGSTPSRSPFRISPTTSTRPQISTGCSCASGLARKRASLAEKLA